MVHPNHAETSQETERILSHSHAIAQCHKFLHSQFKGVICENTGSTAAAAQYINEHPEIKAAAIANELAAKEYGLTIVKPDIHTSVQSYPFYHFGKSTISIIRGPSIFSWL